jgi:hypothetical protein
MTGTTEPIRIYVSHGFRVDEDYLRALDYLGGARRLSCRFVSSADALGSVGREAEREAWRVQIQAAEVVVLLTSHYDADPEGVAFQLRFAQSAGKPVVVVRRFGSVVESPLVLMRAAQSVVDWNERALVDAVRRAARGDAAPRWDTIDFTLD